MVQASVDKSGGLQFHRLAFLGLFFSNGKGEFIKGVIVMEAKSEPLNFIIKYN